MVADVAAGRACVRHARWNPRVASCRECGTWATACRKLMNDRRRQTSCEHPYKNVGMADLRQPRAGTYSPIAGKLPEAMF